MSLADANRGVWGAWVLAPACLVAPVACGPSSEVSQGFRLIGFRQANETRVSVNEELVLHFSSQIDRTSVTPESVRILDGAGLRARGRFRVERTSLHFEPELPRRGDLSDGGLRPGVDYTLELLGFPRPDGLRSSEMELLVSTIRLPFRTTDGNGPSPLFVDLFPTAPFPLSRPLEPRGTTSIGPLDPIVLICGEAIDPRSLEIERFELVPTSGLGKGEGIPMTVRLIENRRDLARLELTPRTGRDGKRAPLSPGTHFLLRVEPGLENLVGRRIETLWKGTLSLEVASDHFEQAVAFEGPFRRPELARRYDGSLSGPPGEEGFGIGYPQAAGNGGAGGIVLSRWNGENDIHATSLVIPRDAEVDLGSDPGPVLLRSQGAIDVEGRLRRRTPSGEASPFLDVKAHFAIPGETLTAFLERARSSPEPWTILVAGGDIRIPGVIETKGPLMLVAGGSIRVTGRIDARETWKSPRGGENLVRVRDLPLLLDPPEVNPLKGPLRMVALSAPIRTSRMASTWGPIHLEGDAGVGSIECEYLGRRAAESSEAGDLVYGPVSDLELLNGCASLEVLVILSVPAGTGEPWSPPRFRGLRIEGRSLPSSSAPRSPP